MFRFNIRDVLWLTVVVALAIGWGLAERRAMKWQKTTKWMNDREKYLQGLDRDTTRRLNEWVEERRRLEGALIDATQGTTQPSKDNCP